MRASRNPLFAELLRTALHDRPSSSGRVGSLIIDSRGIVCFCSGAVARLAGLCEAALIGENVRSIIPELPFKPETEGYNIAFATFGARRRDLLAWSLRGPAGHALQVRGCCAVFKSPAGFVICLDLEYPAPPAQSVSVSFDHKPCAVPATLVAAATSSRGNPYCASLRQSGAN